MERLRKGKDAPNLNFLHSPIAVSTIERQNLTMGMRRFTRLINNFPMKIENHCHTVTRHFVYDTFG
ncbi:hypothetical protein GCM10027299_45250 [Larkinella ripae]